MEGGPVEAHESSPAPNVQQVDEVSLPQPLGFDVGGDAQGAQPAVMALERQTDELQPSSRADSGAEAVAFFESEQHSAVQDGTSELLVGQGQQQQQQQEPQQQGPQPQQQQEANPGAETICEKLQAPAVPGAQTADSSGIQRVSSACSSNRTSTDAADATAGDVISCLQHVLGVAAAKRFNLHLVDDETLALAAGCSVLFLHIPTMQQRFLPGRDGGGVAALAVHPSRELFAVAEKCRSRRPNIYIYSYPNLILQHTLAAGTERAYSAICFSPDGTKLAAVGSAPDYLLTLWDWAAGATLLRCKAFSQEVYGLGFCPHSPGHLVSCGTGHIRFWRMATTFTGLKLQGALGRFGAVELSDVAAFVELPDGKVLSGSEAGDLLLWEGGLIKAVIRRPGGARCHEGAVEVLLHDAQTNYLLSGGGDSTLRLWEVTKVQEAEPPEGSNSVELKPAVTVALQVNKGSSSQSGSSSGSDSSSSGSDGSGGVHGLVWLDRRTWLVQSGAGALLKVSVPLNLLDQAGYTVSQLMPLQGGGVVGCATCPDRHVLMVAAGDGAISAIDYRCQATLQQRRFSSHISSMALLPAAADLEQRSVLLGFADGSVKLVARCSDGWAVLAAVRPHKVPVVCMAVSSDGRRLAAVSADGGVFFLQLGSQAAPQLEPLVSCHLQGAAGASCCCWDPAGAKLLVGSSSGVAVEVSVPQPGALDTSRTYHHQLPARSFTARLPRQKPLQQQHQRQEQQAASETGGSPDGDSNASGAGPAQDGTQQPQQEQQPQQKEQEQEQQPQQQQQPGSDSLSTSTAAAAAEDDDHEQPVLPITWASYQPGSSEVFLLWLGGQAAGQVVTCSWATQPPSCLSSSSSAMSSAAVSVVSSSWSGSYRLLGSTDGRVRLEETGPAPSSWQCPLHDMHDGRVTGLAMAYDDSCLVSAAADGTLLLLHNTLGPPPTATPPPAPQEPNAGLPSVAEATAALPAAAAAAITVAPAPAAAAKATAGQGDVLSCVALSLEDAKQAAQRDQQAARSAAARQQLAAAAEALRQELALLMREDAARPPAERLPPEAFQLDAGLPALIAREREQRLAAAHAQVAYDAEVAQLKLNKLQQYFDATLAEHMVTVHSFGGRTAACGDAGAVAAAGRSHDRSVSTFRPPELPREVMVALAEAEAEEGTQQQGQEQQQQQDTRPAGKVSRLSQSFKAAGRSSKGSFKARISQDVLGHDASKAGSTSSASAALSRAELWRQAKRQRAAEWAAFNASRPDETYDAPEDVAALQQAAATIGDFKLKSDPGFMLPEDQRWTPAKKRHQMLLLLRQLSDARSSHNAQVLALRQRKRGLVAQLNSIQERLAEVNRRLGDTEPLQRLAMQPDEEPEQQLMHVTEAQLAEHQAAVKAAADKAAGLGALGGFAAASSAAEGSGKGAAGKASAQAKQQQRQQNQTDGAVHNAAGGAAPVPVQLSQTELQQLQLEKQQLNDTAAALRTSFDASVAALRSAQLQLAVDLKTAEGRLLMMLKELVLLKDAEAKELTLAAKRDAKLSEAEEMAARMAELQAQLDDKRAEGEAAAARKAAVVGELEVLLSEQDGFKEALTKVFYRRIKRAKKHAPGSVSGADSGDDDSDDNGSDFGNDDGSGSDSSGSEEVCPPGCDPALYDAVVELREHRLDEEEVAAEVTKALEALGKDKTLLAKKAKLIDTALSAINQEVLDFQVDKQARLNQLPAVVSLRRHQLVSQDTSTAAATATEDVGPAAGDLGAGASLPAADSQSGAAAAVPGDLSDSLVFSAQELQRLQQRMQELDEERDALKHQQKELKLQHKQLQEDKSAKEAKLAELTAHCTEVQMLKFGQVIDVSMLDTIGLRNKTADELRVVLQKQTAVATKELSEWDARIAAKRRELLVLLRENTSALTTVTDLTRSQRDLEARMLTGRSELWQDPLSSRRAAIAERDRLVAKISDQATQLEGLRTQLAAMRRKDTVLHA